RPSAPRGPGAVAVVPRAPAGAAATGPQVPNEQRRPTATQAVVISRPLIQVKRVTPSSTAHRQFPMAPGKKAIGEVREFKVVPDHLGRGKDLVDVSKAKEKERTGRGGRKPGEKEGATVSQQDI